MNESAAPRLTVATYNVHGCVGTDRLRSEARIAEVIARTSADVVGLQEVRRSSGRSGVGDQAANIAERLGWYHQFHAAMDEPGGEFGNAIVSRYPLTMRQADLLPGDAPWFCRETRGAMLVTLATALGPIDFVNTHLGLGRAERWQQAQFLSSGDWVGEKPLILVGDFNSLVWSRSVRLLGRNLRNVRALLRHPRRAGTFPTRCPIFALDQVFVNASLEPLSVSVHRDAVARVASDHYPLVVQFRGAPDSP